MNKYLLDTNICIFLLRGKYDVDSKIDNVRLRISGTPLEDNFDLLIGCTAILHNMILVTENIKDFKGLKGIQIENWINRD